MNEEKSQLIRGLTLTDTTALVVGTVIGSGVFLKTAGVTQEGGTPTLVLLAWGAAGLLSLAGGPPPPRGGGPPPQPPGGEPSPAQAFRGAAGFLVWGDPVVVA